jgi:hypothetical protein
MEYFITAIVLALAVGPFIWPAFYTVIRYWTDVRAIRRETALASYPAAVTGWSAIHTDQT